MYFQEELDDTVGAIDQPEVSKTLSYTPVISTCIIIYITFANISCVFVLMIVLLSITLTNSCYNVLPGRVR